MKNLVLRSIMCIFLLLLDPTSSDKDRKRNQDDVFEASNEWKEIKDGQKVPSGLHYRINLSTGKKEAKILHEDETDKENSISQRFTMPDSDENEDTPRTTLDEVEQILKDVNKKNPENDMPKKFRTIEEIKKELGDIQIQPRTDVELMKQLFKRFDKEQKKTMPDDNAIITILLDLRHLSHQIDNGNEFYKLDGFNKIVYKMLNSSNNVVKGESLKLFSALAQNNPKVKVHILESGGITTLLRVLNLETDSNVKKSAITALSCTLRTFPYAQNKFIETGGFQIFTELFKSESIKIKLKIVTLLNDLIMERRNDAENFEHHTFVDIEDVLFKLSWCDLLNELLQDLILVDLNDFDSIEKCLLAMNSMKNKCTNFKGNGLVLKLNGHLSGSERDKDDYLNFLWNLTEQILDRKSDAVKDEL